jgi:hypothetical protein
MWNVDILAPLVKTSMSMRDLVKDTSFIKKNPDHSITLVTRQELAKITLDSLVSLNTPPFNKTAKLSSLVLDSRSDTTKITLGQIADALIANGQAPLGNGIKLAAALHIPVDLSSLPALSLNNMPIDASTLFTDADITAGNLTVQLNNNLPVDIQTLQFDIKNQVDQALIIGNTFSNIPPGGTASISQNLAGMHVEGQMEADIANMQLVGGSSVIVDLNQSIDVILSITGVSVSAANAVFPDQDVVQEDAEVSLIGLTNGIELTYADIASGYLVVDVSSTIEQDLYFTYGVPSAVKSGIPFLVQGTLPAALPGQTSHKVFQYDFSGYGMDLTGQNHDTINTFFNTLLGQIKYTGQQVSLSLADSVVISVTTVNLKPSYVKGYLGNNTIAIGPSSSMLDIFKNIESGTLNFEDVKMNLVIDNGFGLDGALTINNINAQNSRTGSSQTLTGPNIGTPVAIAKATDLPLTNTVNTIDMSTSSNILSLFNSLPDKVNYDAQVTTNTGGNMGTYTDFAYNTSTLSAYLDVEMPLSIIASQLVLGDTVDFNTASIQKKNINSGTFSVFVNNGFPLNASLKMYFLDANGMVLDSVKSAHGAILAAPVNALNKVKEKRASHVSFTADAHRMNNLYNSYKVIFKIEFTTEPAATYVKIYNDYSIDFSMTGNMNYSVHKKH